MIMLEIKQFRPKHEMSKKQTRNNQIIRTQKYDTGQYFLLVVNFPFFFIFSCNFHMKQSTLVVNNLNIKIREI